MLQNSKNIFGHNYFIVLYLYPTKKTILYFKGTGYVRINNLFLYLQVFLGLLSATYVCGSAAVESTAFEQGKHAQSVNTIGPPNISEHPTAPTLLLSQFRNTQATIKPATTTTSVGSLQGKVSGAAEEAETSKNLLPTHRKSFPLQKP